MSNVERLMQAGIELDERAKQRIESLSEQEMASLLALYTQEPGTEILPDNQGWGDQHRSFLDLN
ncbi:MAG: hypothetical protein ACJ76J_04825 [Thermoanaerobaculia bacterium]